MGRGSITNYGILAQNAINSMFDYPDDETTVVDGTMLKGFILICKHSNRGLLVIIIL